MSSLRSKVIRLASTMPKGSEERKALLEVLAASATPEHREKMRADLKKAIAYVKREKNRDFRQAMVDTLTGISGMAAEIGKWEVTFRQWVKYLPDAEYEIQIDVESFPKNLVKNESKTFSSYMDAARYMTQVFKKGPYRAASSKVQKGDKFEDKYGVWIVDGPVRGVPGAWEIYLARRGRHHAKVVSTEDLLHGYKRV